MQQLYSRNAVSLMIQGWRIDTNSHPRRNGGHNSTAYPTLCRHACFNGKVSRTIIHIVHMRQFIFRMKGNVFHRQQLIDFLSTGHFLRLPGTESPIIYALARKTGSSTSSNDTARKGPVFSDRALTAWFYSCFRFLCTQFSVF